jgi:hypothetical protein
MLRPQAEILALSGLLLSVMMIDNSASLGESGQIKHIKFVLTSSCLSGTEQDGTMLEIATTFVCSILSKCNERFVPGLRF